ncbi:MAG: P-type conjugative transfer protein VirB9 [Rickettsiales bacterium]|nr:P-type conjugative transfer protein VirB9 [Rickettsiales bacterium]
MKKILNIAQSLFLKSFILCLAIIWITLPSFAVKEPRATAVDSRLRVMTYNPNDIFKYTGYFGYQSNIEFDTDETIETISMGDTTAWQIVPSGNRMFLKPIEEDATTNMTVITNRRLYFFELHAQDASGPDDPGLVFAVKFLYPDSDTNSVYSYHSSYVVPDLSKPNKYNFNYTVSGSDAIAPIRIFDDGLFTYFEFSDKNMPVPAIFEVDRDRNESVINYQVVGPYIAVEMVASQFTLRYGSDITCVFNENRPFK